ncbi:MAG TPA: glycosyltransferase [Patescibacteria group bacterium]|nr:glycosyltransferase [Patescibacteria group bacterium]
MPKVSCIVPTFKRVDQTLRTIELLLGSDGVGSLFNLEILVSDSTPDESLKGAVGAKFGDRVLYVRPSKPGIAANKNAGATAAKGSILLFCDSDMEVEKNTLQSAVESLKTHPTAAMVGGFVMWRGGSNDGYKDRPRSEDRMNRKGETAYIEALYSRFVGTYKDVFMAVGGYDEQVFNMRGEGSDLSIRYWRAGFPLTFDESIIVHHVFDVPDAAAVRVNHTEWGIARDFLLLGYKYGMFDQDYQSFAATVAMNFAPLGNMGTYRMLQGMGKNYDMLVSAKPFLDLFRATDKPAYDFKFLEIFSNAKAFETCINSAASRLLPARTVWH